MKATRAAVLAAFAATASLGLPAPAGAQPVHASCNQCGVVESVVPVQHQRAPRGIAGTGVTPGMAIGGVVGGLVGNQFGGGSGRAATTLLGAAGGAYAGHAIEKNQGRSTAYRMRIRMRDGSLRTVEQDRALPRGAQVVVEGHHARLA